MKYNDPHYATPHEPPPWRDWVQIYCAGKKTHAFFAMSGWYCKKCGSRVSVVW